MKQHYIDLMEKTLAAYTDQHIRTYYETVQREGLSEHGFPRLTVNIGLLIAHGIRRDLLPLFCEMMEFCCRSIPRVKAANDFSVREVILCLMALEEKQAVKPELIEYWKACLSTINPQTCYNIFARTPDDKCFNWALFTAVSEHLRQHIGLCDSSDFIDLQLTTQLRWLDENGMYRDAEIHPPMVYDLVPRQLFSLLLHFGYDGKYRDRIDASLRKTGLLTLKMQSVTGEIPFGGRSNQFLHNEATLASIFEYEACRYAREGNAALAGQFKAAARRALRVIEEWLNKQPVRHIKNRFPTETRYGCENYAYFDKYMITVASSLYSAYLMCDDSIAETDAPEKPIVWHTSDHFHKLFLNSGGYFLEFDINADPHYDASGLGRVHREGAPSALCLSVPCPSAPNYTLDVQNPPQLTLCPGIFTEGQWQFATIPEVRYEVRTLSQEDQKAMTALTCHFPGGQGVNADYTVDHTGVDICVDGPGRIAHMLPAFCFDGESSPEISHDESSLTISYMGWQCRYKTDGKIEDTELLARNRNGHYRIFRAVADNRLHVKIEIIRQ